MEAATLKALKGSIRKRQRIVRGVGIDHGIHNCPLCNLFFIRPSRCNLKCPVKIKTGRNECDGSPYSSVKAELTRVSCSNGSFGGQAFTSEAKRLAQKEVDFLKSLLPKPPRKKK